VKQAEDGLNLNSIGNNIGDLQLSIMNTSNPSQIQNTPVTRGENSALREHARKQFEQHMKIDTWEVKDELSETEHSISADNRPSDREANNMIAKIPMLT
jgi:hypothetical protein